MRSSKKHILAAVGLIFASACASDSLSPPRQDAAAPAARREAISETRFGRVFTDPYRWLEDVNDREVLAWAHAQNAATEALVGSGRTARLEARLLQLSNFAIIGSYQRFGGREFYLKGLPSSTFSGVFVRDGDGQERWLAGLNPSASSAPVDNAVAIWPSPDGRLVLALVAPLGSPWGELRLYDARTGALSAPAIEGAAVGFSAAAWLSDGSGFVYSVYEPQPGDEANAPASARVLRYDVGVETRNMLLDRPSTSTDDRWVLTPYTANDANQVFVEARLGTSPVTRYFTARNPRREADFQPMFANEANRLLLGAVHGRAFFYTEEGAPNGRVVAVEVRTPGRQTEIIAEESSAIAANSLVGGNAYGLFGDRIVLVYQVDAQPEIRVFDLSGRRTATSALPVSGALWGGFTGNPTEPIAYYRFLGISEPSSVYALHLDNGRRDLITAPQLSFNPEDYVAERIWVERAPGVRVPVSIAYKRGGVANQRRPLILYGYGSFGWSSFLWYQPHLIEWMNQGGAFATVGMRGGGEFGAAWHEAGRALNREVSIGDYIAASEALVERGYTSRDTLIANGSSLAGGVIGAAVVRRPDLYGGALLDFPALDMVRFTEFGHAQYWTQELGSPNDEAAFNVLLGYSPYHILPDALCLPPILVRPGEHDATVTPAHAYKFVARAQLAQTCNNPVRLDVMEGAGHNFGSTPEEISHSYAVALGFLDEVLRNGVDRSAGAR